jgi:hypothetical protein
VIRQVRISALPEKEEGLIRREPHGSPLLSLSITARRQGAPRDDFFGRPARRKKLAVAVVGLPAAAVLHEGRRRADGRVADLGLSGFGMVPLLAVWT